MWPLPRSSCFLVPFAVLAVATTSIFAQQAQPQGQQSVRTVVEHSSYGLWREPTDIRSRNLFDGPGGADGRAHGRLTFVREDSGGSKPKFEAVDERGVRWKVKLGSEARPEVAATRLVWAAGYFADENYYEAALTIRNLPKLRRGQKYVSQGGVVHGARVERDEGDNKSLGEWGWFENPYIGTRELNGLRVLMALINNWDVGAENNAVRRRQGVAGAFYVNDLGSSFGRVEGFTPSRGDADDYEQAGFINRVDGAMLEMTPRNCSALFAVVYTRYFLECKRNSRVFQDIPIAHARWMGRLLGQLSVKQIGDAFRAAGYSPSEVEEFTRGVLRRISALQRL